MILLHLASVALAAGPLNAATELAQRELPHAAQLVLAEAEPHPEVQRELERLATLTGTGFWLIVGLDGLPLEAVEPSVRDHVAWARGEAAAAEGRWVDVPPAVQHVGDDTPWTAPARLYDGLANVRATTEKSAVMAFREVMLVARAEDEPWAARALYEVSRVYRALGRAEASKYVEMLDPRGPWRGRRAVELAWDEHRAGADPKDVGRWVREAEGAREWLPELPLLRALLAAHQACDKGRAPATTGLEALRAERDLLEAVAIGGPADPWLQELVGGASTLPAGPLLELARDPILVSEARASEAMQAEVRALGEDPLATRLQDGAEEHREGVTMRLRARATEMVAHVDPILSFYELLATDPSSVVPACARSGGSASGNGQ